jgi:hypothetical protein
MINHLRGRFTLDADDAAVGMIVVGIEARYTAVLDGGDGRAVGGAKSAITPNRVG